MSGLAAFIVALASACLSTGSWNPVAFAARASAPNIVIILADDKYY
jgi:hypothetical protein